MKVFISHSSKDHDFVLQLAKKMRNDGIEVWLDDWELEVGDSIVEKIQEGLEKSSFLIVILSEYSINSDWVMRELNSTFMRQLNKDHVTILPVLLEIDFEEVPPLLRDIYSVKFERNLIVDSQYHTLISPIRKKLKSEELAKFQDKFFENIEHIDLILKKKKPSRHEVTFIIELIKNTHYGNYFLKQADALHWFNILKAEGYFDAKNAPGPQPADQEGFYSIPWWNVLSYLEKVSEQVTIAGNERYIDELLNIIRDVSNYKNDKGEHIDNYHTWSIFVKILNNIPNVKIPIVVIDLIPIWLDSKFDTSLVGSEIGLKLLPKFLFEKPSEEDIFKAEKIVDYITDVKSIKPDKEKAGIFNRLYKFKLKVDLYYVKEVFEKYSKDLGEKCTNNVVDTLCDKIRPLLKREESLIPFETDSKAYLFALSSDHNTCAVEVFDVGEKADFKVYEQVFRMKKSEGAPIRRLLIDETSLDDFKSKVFEFLTQDEPFKSSDAKQLKRDIYNLYCNYYDSETYTSLYDESRTYLTEPLEVLSFALKSILLFRAKKHVEETKEILTRFFKDKYLYFTKMALYIIGNNISIYGDVFWNALEKDKSNLIFGEIYFGDELRVCLENLSDLSDDQKDLLINKLEQGPGFIPEENPDMYIAEWKQERCQALIKFPEFKELYKSLKSKTGVDVGLHAAVGEIRTRWDKGLPPLTKEEILKMLTANKLPSYLKDFKSKGFWEGPTVGGLAMLIKECAAEQPGIFIKNLSPFDNTGFIYIYEILDGVREAWKNKQNIAWDKLFEFIHKYIDRRDFWEDHFVVEKSDFLGGANHFWIIGVVTDLITEGTRDDSWAFDEQYLKEAEEILFLIFDNLEAEDEEAISDYVTHALNSSHGKTLSAFINLTLRIARINDKKGAKAEVKWSEKIKGKYDELLEKKIIESYTFLGRYLPNLFYLDKAWAEEKVKRLYPESANRYWEAFMDGYLSIGTVYNDLYELMNPHYVFGISYDFKEKHDNEHLVQHIALGYLLGFDKRDIDNSESLIRKVLDGWKPIQISDIVSFLWSQQRYLREGPEGDKKIVERIISIWRWIYENKYKDKSQSDITEDDKLILSDLGRLAVFLPHIDKEYAKWLMLPAPYANENYNASFFIESLDKFEDRESLGYVGRIFLKMLDHFIPDFDQKHICSIVEKLYKNNYKEDADNICNIYGMKGYEFLRDLYERYNKTE
jgi:hypothetical protein